MRHIALIAALLPLPLLAQGTDDITKDIVENHILPRMEILQDTAADLATTASTDCAATSPALRGAYGKAFDAWIAVSHLRFGPTEVDDRAFSLAFWPDSRGATPKVLSQLISQQDPIAGSVEGYTDISIAARGFYALEFLLYDETISTLGDSAYRCTLVRTVTADISQTTADMASDWQTDFGDALMNPSADGPYRSANDAHRELFKALSTGLQFTSDTRLGRPLGTFERPRPNRAEARRSERSLRNVQLSLVALQDLAIRLSGDHPPITEALQAGFSRSADLAENLNDPVFAGVADPQGRFKVEVLQQSIDAIRLTVRDQLGPTLGVAAGFNALDGD